MCADDKLRSADVLFAHARSQKRPWLSLVTPRWPLFLRRYSSHSSNTLFLCYCMSNSSLPIWRRCPGEYFVHWSLKSLLVTSRDQDVHCSLSFTVLLSSSSFRLFVALYPIIHKSWTHQRLGELLACGLKKIMTMTKRNDKDMAFKIPLSLQIVISNWKDLTYAWISLKDMLKRYWIDYIYFASDSAQLGIWLNYLTNAMAIVHGTFKENVSFIMIL